MKAYKRLLIGTLSMALLSGMPVMAAQEELVINNEPYETQIIDAIPISAGIDEDYRAAYASFTGTVKEITHSPQVKGLSFYLVENVEGQEATIVVSEDTIHINEGEIEVGSVITGFYDANAPMLMIYPPQYSADVVALQVEEEQSITVDRFDENLLSSDGSLRLNLSDETEIIAQDGTEFEGSLTDRNLVVIYSIIAESYPAQTTPERIIVLDEKADPVIEEEGPELTETITISELVVNNEKLTAPTPFLKEDGTVMVPLRAVAEALDFEVSWDEASKTISLNEGIVLTIDEDQYEADAQESLTLGAAPVIIEGRTFVPLSFFKEVTDMNNAYVLEGQVVIDNAEVME